MLVPPDTLERVLVVLGKVTKLGPPKTLLS